MITILRRSILEWLKLYVLFMSVVCILGVGDNLPFWHIKMMAVILLPCCLWPAICIDFMRHSPYMNPRPPYEDPKYKEAGINGLGSINKHP